MRINSTTPANIEKNKTVSYKSARTFVRTLANPDALLPTVLLETSVTGGRGYNEYKRSGINGLRERATDDILAAIFWMKGVDIFNSIGDAFGKKVLKLPTTEFDMGNDALRKPFANVVADLSKQGMNSKEAAKMAKKLSRFKLGKIITASILSTAFVGFALPKINQGITRFFMSKDASKKTKEPNQNNLEYTNIGYSSIEEFGNKISKNSKPSFKGKMEIVAHYLENNKICKLLTSDVGITSGRVVTARNVDEGVEYGVRDVISSFFYTASTPLIYFGLQELTKSKGITSLDPVASKQLSDHLISQLGQNGQMNAAEFAQKSLGVLDDLGNTILSKVPFEKDVVSFKDFAKLIRDEEFVKSLNLPEDSKVLKNILNKAAKMTKLQPKQAGIGGVLTKQQVQDVLKNGSINTPEFMQAIYGEHFGAKLTDSYRFIPMKNITKFRDNIDDYINDVVKHANKKNNGVVTKELLEKVNKKGFVMSAGFRAIALGISALALGWGIPKLQHAITKYRTGSSAAPGLREYEQQEEKKA